MTKRIVTLAFLVILAGCCRREHQFQKIGDGNVMLDMTTGMKCDSEPEYVWTDENKALVDAAANASAIASAMYLTEYSHEGNPNEYFAKLSPKDQARYTFLDDSMNAADHAYTAAVAKADAEKIRNLNPRLPLCSDLR